MGTDCFCVIYVINSKEFDPVYQRPSKKVMQWALFLKHILAWPIAVKSSMNFFYYFLAFSVAFSFCRLIFSINGFDFINFLFFEIRTLYGPNALLKIAHCNFYILWLCRKPLSGSNSSINGVISTSHPHVSLPVPPICKEMRVVQIFNLFHLILPNFKEYDVQCQCISLPVSIGTYLLCPPDIKSSRAIVSS